MAATQNWQFASEDLILLLLLVAGWVLILKQALGKFNVQSNTAWKKTSEEFDQLTQKTQVLFNDMEGEFDTQFSEVKRELAQLRTLLEDAINKLLTCFTAIESQTRQQHSLSLGLIDCNSPEIAAASEINMSKEALIEQLDTISEQTEQNVRSAITSLQFQDMATQIIAHVRNRVDSLESIMKSISNVHMTQNRHDPDSLSDFVQNLNHFKRAIDEASEVIAKAKYNPVSQTHMEAGDIDLF